MNANTNRPPRALTARRLAESAGLIRTAFVAAAVAGLGAPAWAGPDGAQVVAGSANIQHNGANTIIRAGNGAIINYQSFNIRAGETVRFIQPSATSRVLNRITGPDPSRIAGTLLANGIVYIVNPAGVFFAHGSLVNVGGLYAAAGNITNQNFIHNVNQFTGVGGTVENRGTIDARAAHLVGAHVANFGAINAPNGMVTMSAGGEVYIGEQGGQIFARVSGQGSGTGVTQAGQINAAGGQVRLGAGDMYAVAIDHPGSTRAHDITLRGGRGGVVSSSGTLDASSASGRGGNVALLGDRVGVFGGEIDASGATGGGTVLVGGDFRGQGDTPRAEATFVAPSARIKADATVAGDGGKVVVWSDHFTNFQGHISARGGELGGDGGAIETSGKDKLLMVGGATAAAPRGHAGSWLLDPTDVTLSNAATSNGTISGMGVFDPDAMANTANVNLGDIVTALQGGTSVTINTTSSGSGMGDISLTDPFAANLPSDVSLTLNAEHDINFTTPGATITATGAGAFTLVCNATNDVNVSQAISIDSGAFNVNAGGDVALGGTVSVGGASGSGRINVQAGGDVGVLANLSASTSLTLRSGNDGTGDLTFSGSPLVASDSITLRAGDGPLGMTGAMVDAITGTPMFARFDGTAAPVAFTIRQDADLADAAIPGVGQFAGGAVAGMNYHLTSDDGMVTVSTAAKVAGSDLTLNGATGAAIGNTLSLNSLTVLSALNLNGDITTTGGQVYGGAVTLAADTTLAGTNVTFSGAVDSSGGARNLTVNTSGGGLTTFGGDVGAMSALGTLTTNADGKTTFNSPTVHADVLDFQDDVLAGSDTVLNAATSANFAGRINSEAGEANDITINSPLISFHNNIGGGMGGVLGLFKTGAGAMTTFDASVLKAARIDFGGPIVMNQSAVLTGTQSIIFRSTVSSQSGMARDLTLNSPLTNFNGPVGGGMGGAFGTLTTDVDGTTTINAASVRAATVDFKDSVVVAFDTTVTGTTRVDFEGAVDSRSGQSKSLTVNAPDTHFGGVVGGAGSLGMLATDAAGTTHLDGLAVTADQVDLHDAVVLDKDAVITAPMGVHFYSTLDSGVGGHSLSLVSAQITFDGAVGAAMDGALGNLTSDAGSQVNLAGPSIDALSIAFRNTTQLRHDVTLTGENSIRLGGAVTSQAGMGGFALTVHAPSIMFGAAVGGGVGSGNELTSLTTQGATSLGGGVTTLQDQTYMSAVRLAGDNIVLSGHNITFQGTLDSASSDRMLTINTSGNGTTAFMGGVGQIVPLMSLTLNQDGQTIIAGPQVAASGNQDYENRVVIAANTSISGTNVLFNSTVDSDATPRNLTVQATGTGNVTFMQAVGGMSVLANLTASSAAGGSIRLNGGTVATTTGQTYNGTTVLGTSTLLTGSAITFGGTLNSGAVPSALAIATGPNGTTTFRGAVGGSQPLTTLSVDGKTQIFGSMVRTSSTQAYGGAVAIGEDTTLGGTSITFGSTIDATPLFGAKSLTVNASGMTIFGGAIGASAALNTLTTDAPGTTQIGSDVHTEGGMAFNDAVTVMHDAAFTDTGTGAIAFGGTLDSGNGHHALSLIPGTSGSGTVAAPQVGRISFGGNVGGASAFSTLTLGGDRTTNPGAATIFAGLGSNGMPATNFSLTINTTGAFTMGARQKMSVLGNLTINSGGTARLGDISTLGNLDVNAPAIVVRTRPGGPELVAVHNTLRMESDTRTDYVAGGHLHFSSTPTLEGGFEAPAFATVGASGISDNLMNFAQFSLTGLTADQFHVGATALDLRAIGSSNANLAEAIAGQIPTEAQSGFVPEPAVISEPQAAELRELGINVASAGEEELGTILASGATVYQNVPEKPSPAATDLRVSPSRLPAPVVTEVLADYHRVFDTNGQPAPEQPRQTLQAAWDQYVKAAGDKADPLGFRAYVEALPSQAQALYYMDGLRTLFSDMGRLGLSPVELRHAKDVILSRVTFPGLSPEALEAAITARYFGATASIE